MAKYPRGAATMPHREKVIFLRRFPGAGQPSTSPSQHSMNKASRYIISACALLGVSATVAACGGVPGNAVATVDGESVSKTDFSHWLTVAAKSSGQANAAVPDPQSDYKNCVAQKRKTTPAPAKGQPKVTDAQLKTQCKTEYTQLRDQVLQLLISFKWIQGEADSMGVKVTDADVKKSFAEQKKQSFPKDTDYKKFLQTSGQSESDILERVRLDLLSNKIRDKVIKGKDTVSDAAIQDFYNKNKARFAQPEKRDLRVVLTKKKDEAQTAYNALKGGDSWSTVAKKYSIDDTSKAAGGKLPAQAKGTLDKQLDDAVFSAKKNQLEGPIKTQYGYYDFEVTKVTPASQQTLDEAKATIKQTLQSQNQQKALDAFVKDFTKRWKDKTECSENYKTTDCKNGPKATPTPTAPATQAPPATGTATPSGQ
jgi:foldase protein PrsA